MREYHLRRGVSHIPEGMVMVPYYVGGMVVLLIAILGMAARYYTRVPPNKVAVVFGRRPRDTEGTYAGFRLVHGGGFMNWPIIVSVQWLSLEVMPIPVMTTASVTVDGVPVRVDTLANVKIGSTESLQRAAAERFLGMAETELHQLIQETIDARLCAIVSTTKTDDLIQKRDALSADLREQSAKDLEAMGLVIDSMVVREIAELS